MKFVPLNKPEKKRKREKVNKKIKCIQVDTNLMMQLRHRLLELSNVAGSPAVNMRRPRAAIFWQAMTSLEPTHKNTLSLWKAAIVSVEASKTGR